MILETSPYRLTSRWNHVSRSGSCLIGQGYLLTGERFALQLLILWRMGAPGLVLLQLHAQLRAPFFRGDGGKSRPGILRAGLFVCFRAGL